VIVDPGKLALFLGATAALILTPGPAVLYVVARSLSQGRRAGLVSVLGIGAGNAVHAAAGVLGLAALLASSAVAFTAVKYLGAAYLVFLGVAKLLSPREAGTKADGPGQGAAAPSCPSSSIPLAARPGCRCCSSAGSSWGSPS
jgi:threonine/homoserine/homoserine lactone efflux protein